jgi:hypothetical protein
MSEVLITLISLQQQQINELINSELGLSIITKPFRPHTIHSTIIKTLIAINHSKLYNS